MQGSGSAILVKRLRFSTTSSIVTGVLARAQGYEAAGWMPVHVSPDKPAVHLMLLEKDADLNFSVATWDMIASLASQQ